MAPRSARALAIQALVEVDCGARANVIVPDLLASSGLAERDRAFVTELVYGTVRMRRACDWLVDRHARRRPDRDVMAALRLGTYQLVFLGTPPHAAVSATVDALGGRGRGFANAVLRRVAEDSASGPPQWPDDGTRLSYPDWIVERLTADIGSAEALAALAAMNEPASPTLRPDGYSQDLASQWVGAIAVGAEGAGGAVGAVGAVGAGGGERFVDLCAAPGGKATWMAYGPGGPRAPGVAEVAGVAGVTEMPGVAEMPGASGAPGAPGVSEMPGGPGEPGAPAVAEGRTVPVIAAAPREPAAGGPALVVAADIDFGRARVTAANASRLGLGNVATVVADACHPPLKGGSFDRVLVDAPCSGLGVLRRRPDARWRIRPDDLPRLASLQRRMLDAALPLVKPGGVLVYSVCTFTLVETAAIDRWLAEVHPEARPLMPPGAPWVRVGRGARLLPQAAGTDGMFVLALRVADAAPPR